MTARATTARTTAVERVRRTQRILAAAALTQAFAWGLAAALVAVALISFSSLAIPRVRNDLALYDVVPLLLGESVAAGLLWRSRNFLSTNRVALWIEERVPGLQYSLVTVMEHGESPFSEGLEGAVAEQNVGGVTLAALRRGWIAAATALVAALLLLYVSPSAGRTNNYAG